VREWVTVAVVLKERGNRGEVAAIPLTSQPGRFNELRKVFLFDPQGNPLRDEPFLLEEAWDHQGRIVLKFEGIDSISQATELRGSEVRIPLEQRAILPDDEYYHSDLLGCEVVDHATGRLIGKVTGWQDHGGPGLLEVSDDEKKGEILVPFARSICKDIDVARKRIRVDLPEGLLDLNRG
jgi:16S rRNA processing protein RimM